MTRLRRDRSCSFDWADCSTRVRNGPIWTVAGGHPDLSEWTACFIREAEVNSWAPRLSRLGGMAAFLGGLAWTLKGVVMLAGGDQPPLLFEAAPTLFGLGLMSVANSHDATWSPSRHCPGPICDSGPLRPCRVGERDGG